MSIVGWRPILCRRRHSGKCSPNFISTYEIWVALVHLNSLWFTRHDLFTFGTPCFVFTSFDAWTLELRESCTMVTSLLPCFLWLAISVVPLSAIWSMLAPSAHTGDGFSVESGEAAQASTGSLTLRSKICKGCKKCFVLRCLH